MKKQYIKLFSFLLIISSLQAYQNDCGNPQDNDPPDCPPVGANPINPARGGLARHVTDIKIFGPAPFAFERIYNSRTRDYTQRSWELGTTYTWQHNWQYEMRESSDSDFGFPKIIVRYPEGREKYFSAVDSSGSVRVPDANWGDRLYPTGNVGEFILRTPAGREYSFLKTGTSDYQYLLTQVRSGTGWAWTLTYQTQSDGKQRLYRITNNYGRYIELTRSQVTGTNFWKIDNVKTNDLRYVYYTYSTWAPTSEKVLTSVLYPGTEVATYTWVGATSLTTGPPVLESAVDPLYPGAGSRTKYIYNYAATYGGNNIVNGTVLEERNYDTGDVIVSLPLGGGIYPQILEGNGTEITRKYAGDATFSFSNVIEQADGEGRKIIHVYQTAGGIANSGFRTSSTDDRGATTSYEPDYAGRTLSTTDAYLKTSYNTYSNNGFLLSHTDELGHATIHTRDPVTNRISRTDYQDGAYETFTYTGTGLMKTHRLKNGFNETMSYDSFGNLITLVDAAGKTWT